MSYSEGPILRGGVESNNLKGYVNLFGNFLLNMLLNRKRREEQQSYFTDWQSDYGSSNYDKYMMKISRPDITPLRFDPPMHFTPTNIISLQQQQDIINDALSKATYPYNHKSPPPLNLPVGNSIANLPGLSPFAPGYQDIKLDLNLNKLPEIYRNIYPGRSIDEALNNYNLRMALERQEQSLYFAKLAQEVRDLQQQQNEIANNMAANNTGANYNWPDLSKNQNITGKAAPVTNRTLSSFGLVEGKLPNGIEFIGAKVDPKKAKFSIKVYNSRVPLEEVLDDPDIKESRNVLVFNGCQLEDNKFKEVFKDRVYQPQGILIDKSNPENYRRALKGTLNDYISNAMFNANKNRVLLGLTNNGKLEIIPEINAYSNLKSLIQNYYVAVGGLVPLNINKSGNEFFVDLKNKNFGGFITNTTTNKSAIVVTPNNGYFIHTKSTNVEDVSKALVTAVVRSEGVESLQFAKAAAFDAGSATSVYVKINGKEKYKYNYSRVKSPLSMTSTNNLLIVRF